MANLNSLGSFKNSLETLINNQLHMYSSHFMH